MLEVTTPLWHMGWAGWVRAVVSADGRGEILQMARTPLRWGEGAGDTVIAGKAATSEIC